MKHGAIKLTVVCILIAILVFACEIPQAAGRYAETATTPGDAASDASVDANALGIQSMALLVGMKSVDPGTHDGWEGKEACTGYEKNIAMMTDILSPSGYTISTLTTTQATHDGVLSALDQASTLWNAGDIFVFYFSGHGGQEYDYDGDETDEWDETLVTYDYDIVDDELNAVWAKFREGVRIVMISDCCSSGTNYRGAASDNTLIDGGIAAGLIHLGASSDDAVSYASIMGGNFTIALTSAWYNFDFLSLYRGLPVDGSDFLNYGHDKTFTGYYRSLKDKINSYLDGKQIAQYNEYGNVSYEFKAQIPFSNTIAIGKHNYGFEGIVGYVHPGQAADSIPLYRYWNSKVKDHFYTSNWDELGTGKGGYQFEQIQGYLYPTQMPGTVPLFRFYSASAKDHFYSLDFSEVYD